MAEPTTEPRQPYAGPADDGGDQGAFTKPGDSMVAADPAAPEDRKAAGSHWSPGMGETKERNAHPWQSAMFTLLTLLILGSVFVFFAYCNMPR